jgi:hypothetical protein
MNLLATEGCLLYERGPSLGHGFGLSEIRLARAGFRFRVPLNEEREWLLESVGHEKPEGIGSIPVSCTIKG